MMAEIPGELVAKPLALIGLIGLDTSNTIHRSIWDGFINNRRPDGTSFVQYKLLNTDTTFPLSKPKRNSYEWYIPKGILKRKWMNKYLNIIPSVVVYFYDLDWNDPLWNDKKLDCANKVKSLKNSLDGRNTKITVVLIQKGSQQPPPGSEDVVATERATSLCSACELSAKSLYILPHGDHLLGYISRLENAFYELSQNFYHHQYKIVKGHKEQLNKITHQYLFVRHQFKMGFFNELKQDKATALKHYQYSYNNLLEIRMVDTNNYEIKIISGFINFKICRLMFILNQPRDAITQFRNHIDKFKVHTGPDDLLFEHNAWLSTQYSTFAELFDEAIRQGLSPAQTQHPGYYFQLAAQYANLRQLSCKQLCYNINYDVANCNLLDNENDLEYYGQRPWRPGKLSAEPIDMARETAGINALKYREKNVNHSMIIIGLLGNAISQFKAYRCPRMRRLLVVQMAGEYYNTRDYSKVLTLLMHMLWDYRNERWPVLLTDVLRNALRAAYLSINVQDYLTLSIEALSPFNTFSKDNRNVIYNNILSILKKQPPIPEIDLPDDDKNLTLNKWNYELNRNDKLIITIDDYINLSSFINIKSVFNNSTYTVGNNITIEIYIKNLYDDIIEFSNIIVTISTPNNNIEYNVIKKTNDDFKFHSNQIKKLLCKFPAPLLPDGTVIKIVNTTVYFGNDSNYIVMKFSNSNHQQQQQHHNNINNNSTSNNNSNNSNANINDAVERYYPRINLNNDILESTKLLTTAEIKQEETSLTIKLDSKKPALLSEWLPINVTLIPNQYIENITITVKQSLDDNINANSNDLSTDLSLNMIDKENILTINIDNLDKDNNVIKIFYIRSHQTGQRNVNIKVEYKTKSDININKSKDFIYTLAVVKPFDVTTQFYTQLFETLPKAFVNEPFIVMPHIVCTSPWPIQIIDTSIELGHSIMRKDKDHGEKNEQSILKDVVLKEGETGTDVYCVVAKVSSEQPTSTGVYTIRWRRNDDDSNSIETSTSVTLSPLWVDDVSVGLEVKLPAHGWVRTPLCVSYFIKNYSDTLFTLKLTMEASDAFMFAGQKQIDISIRPKNQKKVEWILRPLVAGFVALPTLSLSVSLDEEHKLNKSKLVQVLERSLPTHIFIMPNSLTEDT